MHATLDINVRWNLVYICLREEDKTIRETQAGMCEFL